MLIREEIKNTNHPKFLEAWEIYQNSFPIEEKRVLEEQKQIFENKNYKFLLYLKEEKVIGFLASWESLDYTFVEHFAVSSKNRGQNFGSWIFKDFIKEKKNIVLEIDLPKDELSKRRLAFYEKFDFIKCPFKHFQIPFRKDEEELELMLLSYKKIPSEEKYKEIFKNLKKEFY